MKRKLIFDFWSMWIDKIYLSCECVLFFVFFFHFVLSFKGACIALYWCLWIKIHRVRVWGVFSFSYLLFHFIRHEFSIFIFFLVLLLPFCVAEHRWCSCFDVSPAKSFLIYFLFNFYFPFGGNSFIKDEYVFFCDSCSVRYFDERAADLTSHQLSTTVIYVVYIVFQLYTSKWRLLSERVHFALIVIIIIFAGALLFCLSIFLWIFFGLNFFLFHLFFVVVCYIRVLQLSTTMDFLTSLHLQHDGKSGGA